MPKFSFTFIEQHAIHELETLLTCVYINVRIIGVKSCNNMHFNIPPQDLASEHLVMQVDREVLISDSQQLVVFGLLTPLMS